MKRITELTEKQRALIPLLSNYPNIQFTSALASEWNGARVAGATLSSLANQGILNLIKKSPNTYTFTAIDWLEWNKQQDVICADFTQEEMDKEIVMSYIDLCHYLTQKYGAIDEPFYKDTDYHNGSNTTIRRSHDGLYIHHIDENKFIMLSNTEYIKMQNAPYECQLPDHLVYCNTLEHIILHWKIYKEYNNRPDKPIITVNGITAPVQLGIGGIFNYIVPLLNERYLNGYDKTTGQRYIRWNWTVYWNLLKLLEADFNRPDIYSLSYSGCISREELMNVMMKGNV